MCGDQGSLTRQNLNLISEESDYENVLEASPKFISSLIKYAEVPEEEKWRIGFLQELLLIRENKLQIGQNLLSKEEVQDLINVICTT